MIGLIPFLAAFCGCKCDSTPPDDPVPFVRLLKDQSFQSHLLNRSVKYAVLLPKEYEKGNSSFPVVYLLHGFGEDETGWYKWGLINYYVDLNESETVPMVYVMPQGFNTYWVNKYNGTFPYMDMLVGEMVPLIDSLFRTVKDPHQRAVMGYSMGGYGAMILPAKNPDIFKTGIALSMSFRNDEQYLDEPQGVFDLQWGSVFGGIGRSGTARLTDYYLNFNPFHFFKNAGDLSLNGQNYYFDCGDDEESLIIPNNDLHCLLRELNIKHEFRVNNGAHNWDYWHKALPEALRYISLAVQDLPYPDDQRTIDPGLPVPAERMVYRQLDGSSLTYNVALPAFYASDTNHYPVILVLHDRDAASADSQSQRMLSTINKSITENLMPACLTVEIPMQSEPVTAAVIKQVLIRVRSEFRTRADKKHTFILANNKAGGTLYDLLPECEGLVNSCLLFDARLPDDATVNTSDISYFLDICDESDDYAGYRSLYMSLKQTETDHDYRVRQGIISHDSFLYGLAESAAFIKKHL
jgi:enterochelin esterase-like enzyme